MPTSYPRTFSRAESAPAPRQIPRDREELGAALLAFSPHCSSALASHQDERLTILDSLSLPIRTAVGVAGVAGGNQILRSVISPIPVDVIGEDCARSSRASSNDPVQLLSAPMAGMRPRPDLVVEHDSSYREVAAGWSDRMLRSSAHVLLMGALRPLHLLLTALSNPIAPLRAIPAGVPPRNPEHLPTVLADRSWASAMGAGVMRVWFGHLTSVSERKWFR